MPENTALTAYALSFFCLGLFAQSGVLLMNRVFYAIQDTWTPVITGAGTILLNVLLNYTLVGWLDIGGLALAYSIAGIANLAALLFWIRRKIGAIGSKKIAVSFGRILGMSTAMGIAVFTVSQLCARYLVDIQTKTGQLLQVIFAISAGALVYFGLSFLLKVEEADMVKRMLMRRRRATES